MNWEEREKKKEKRGKKKEKKRPPPHTHTHTQIRGTALLMVFIRGTDIAYHVHEQLACHCAFQQFAHATQRTHLLFFGTGPKELSFDGVSSTQSCTAAC
jgi:uncharacterized CHY-type Zn-finger protein